MVASIADQFPGSERTLAALTDIVRTYRTEAARNPHGLELELRFGTVHDHTHARTGVSSAFVENALELVQTNPAIVIDAWRESQDAFYTTRFGQERRCRSEYNTEGICVETTTIVKSKIVECTLVHKSTAVRVVLSRETPVRETADVVVDPTHVRIQQRRRAHLVSNGFGPRDTWVLDVGMTWSGATKSDAERLQMCSQCPQYTLELELMDASYVARHDDEYVACSMALKAADFLGNDLNTHFQILTRRH